MLFIVTSFKNIAQQNNFRILYIYILYLCVCWYIYIYIKDRYNGNIHIFPAHITIKQNTRWGHYRNNFDNSNIKSTLSQLQRYWQVIDKILKSVVNFYDILIDLLPLSLWISPWQGDFHHQSFHSSFPFLWISTSEKFNFFRKFNLA